MKKSNLIFGSILSILGLLYVFFVLGLIGDVFFSIGFVVLIIIFPILTEKFNENDSIKEYIVKGIFAGCLLLALFVDAGLIFELITAGVIILSGFIIMFFDNIKKMIRKK